MNFAHDFTSICEACFDKFDLLFYTFFEYRSQIDQSMLLAIKELRANTYFIKSLKSMPYT